MSNLKSTLENLATDFAASVLEALRSASLDELMEVSKGPGRRGGGRGAALAIGAGRRRGKGGRLGRRSSAELNAVLESIVGLLEKNPKGLRAENIRENLGLEAKELPRPLAEGIRNGSLRKTGQKRATTYFAGGKKRKG